MMSKEVVHSNLPIPPGEYLAEVITELGMTKDELARRMNRPAPKLSAIFSGDKAITPDTALQLEKVVGVPAHIWTGLESEYRLTIARNQQKEEEQQLRAESNLVTRFCYKELAKFGFVRATTKPLEKVLELQRFFGVTSLKNIAGLKRYQVAFRCGQGMRNSRSPEALAAWLRMGEVTAQKATCPSFDKRKLEKALPELRALTQEPQEKFQARLRELLAGAGVVLVIVPHLPKTSAHGATFWLSNHRAVLMLTIRGVWADIFWFSLFHEIGHILLHPNLQTVIIESDDEPENSGREQQADRFAANTLLPPGEYQRFVEAGSFYEGDIERFAREMKIDPGIMVGRLQHDGHIENAWHNKLRSRYQWKQNPSGG